MDLEGEVHTLGLQPLKEGEVVGYVGRKFINNGVNPRFEIS